MKWIDVENEIADLDEKLIDRTKGFLDKEEGLRLYQAGLEASTLGPCLEIGSYCGKSTLYLGAACRKNSSTRIMPLSARSTSATRRVLRHAASGRT